MLLIYVFSYVLELDEISGPPAKEGRMLWTR